LLHWAPRVLTLAFVSFLSLFALDVFESRLGFWRTLVALLIHLVPTFVLLSVLAVSWRREWIGGLAYLALAAAYVIQTRGRLPFATYVMIAGPLVVIGVLFLAGWQLRARLRPGEGGRAGSDGPPAVQPPRQ
jgi:hypothetical protein